LKLHREPNYKLLSSVDRDQREKPDRWANEVVIDERKEADIGCISRKIIGIYSKIAALLCGILIVMKKHE
jgi:hypothetical protein